MEGVNDAEPRDDTRQFVVDVSLDPAAVIFASPPDWEARFLARTLSDVARVPVKVFVETEAGRWRDGASLAPVATPELTRAAAGARLVVAMGDPERARAFTGASRSALMLWPTNGQTGDWYVERPLASPFTAPLAGVVWDSLPPATAVAVPARDSSRAATVALTARLARRGVARPILTLLFPHLASIVQPLAGEYAGRRELLEQLPFVEGYGVDIALLIDVAQAFGTDAIAQVDLGTRVHRNRPLAELSPQAEAVLLAALSRAGRLDVDATERPPLATVPSYRRRSA